ncbi:unnamed protein product [Bursaphelenchus xylophilus]|uniref:(pine wood nematode) hypothetical protein n=1 Tax=Bursaphelenchus xylophilus TaxID=6326 RepID=A0A7I8WN32_BURXY|nr:unnamed protein product [Bursaphelenchus xylophilus]CAG9092734.1 unnamed protein product [Bursaphelenchus xylophilus]
MIPISSVFSHLPCADGFECRRPYCRYNHTAINTPRSPERSATDLVKEGLIPQKKTTEIPSGPVVIQQETYDEYSYQGYYAQDEDEDEPFAPAEPMYNPYDPLGKKAESQKKTKEPVKAKAVEFSMMDKPALPVDLGEDDILLNLNPEAKKEKEVVKTKVPKKPEPPRPIKLSELHTKRRNSKELMKEEQEDEVSIKKRKLTQEHLEELEKKAKLFDMYMKNLHKAADIDAQIKEIEGRRNQMKHDPSFVDSLFEAEPSKPMVEEKPTTSSAITTPILTANSMGKRIVNGKITAKNQMLNRLESAQKANLAKKNEPINISLKLAAEKRAVGGTKTAPSMINKVAKQWATGNGSNRTASSTVSKGETRTAHSGNNATLLPLDMHSSKIPVAFRTKYLKMLYNEFCKHDLLPGQCIQMSQREEKAILDKSSTQSGYTSLMVGVVRVIRSGGFKLDQTNEMKTSVTEIRSQHTKKRVDEEKFYRILKEKYLMTDQLLKDNGYPLVVKVNGKPTVEIKSADEKKVMFIEDTELKRTCCRCGAEYGLKKDGSFVKQEDCVFHWKRAYKRRINKTLESRYACCDGELTVKGCAIQSVHVHETMRKSVLQQFCRTPPPIDKNDRRSNKVYAMDCEMVFTTWGMSVARVSVVDVNDEEVLDIIIKPKDKVLDCNTKFSGLTEEMLEKAEYDLDKARKKLFELINSETILIGHSLESDLRALRLVHRKVVDTAIVFPHRLGPPFKRALRTLASEYLQKIIQEDTSGHCSKEDSSACIQLMLHKVRSEPGSNL